MKTRHILLAIVAVIWSGCSKTPPLPASAATATASPTQNMDSPSLSLLEEYLAEGAVSGRKYRYFLQSVAKANHQLGHPTRALELMKRAESEFPDQLSAMVHTYAQLGRLEDVLRTGKSNPGDVYRAIKKTWPKEARTLLLEDEKSLGVNEPLYRLQSLARELQVIGEGERANLVVDRIIREYPEPTDSSQIHSLLGVVDTCTNLSRQEDAKRLLELCEQRLAQLDKESQGIAAGSFAQHYIGQDEATKADRYLKMILEISEQSQDSVLGKDLLMMAADLRVRQGEDELVFRLATKVDDPSDFLTTLLLLSKKPQTLDKVALLLRETRTIEPSARDRFEAWSLLVEAYLRTEQRDKAEEYLAECYKSLLAFHADERPNNLARLVLLASKHSLKASNETEIVNLIREEKSKT